MFLHPRGLLLDLSHMLFRCHLIKRGEFLFFLWGSFDLLLGLLKGFKLREQLVGAAFLSRAMPLFRFLGLFLRLIHFLWGQGKDQWDLLRVQVL
jgi:hypothetical protein